MEITSLVSLVIILFIIFLVLSSKPSKMEKFNTSNLDLVIEQNDFVYFKKFNDKEPTSAKYGSEGKSNDVTQIIKDRYEIWKSTGFQVTNDSMGGDPHPGDVKKLRIWYNDSNNNHNNVDLIFEEYDFVEIRRFNREPKYAKYGSEGQNNDVTQIIKDKYENWKSTRFQVTNDSMGGNPNRNDEKKLRIKFN
jgi:hypothetical protein